MIDKGRSSYAVIFFMSVCLKHNKAIYCRLSVRALQVLYARDTLCYSKSSFRLNSVCYAAYAADVLYECVIRRAQSVARGTPAVVDKVIIFQNMSDCDNPTNPRESGVRSSQRASSSIHAINDIAGSYNYFVP